jgi:hypothetical protein
MSAAKRTLFTCFNIPGGRLVKDFFEELVDIVGESNVSAAAWLGVKEDVEPNEGLGLEVGRRACFVLPFLGIIWRDARLCLAAVMLCLGLARSVRGAELDFGLFFGVDDTGGTEARRALLCWVAGRVLGVRDFLVKGVSCWLYFSLLGILDCA